MISNLVVLSHLHYDHAGGIELLGRAELVVQQDEYAYAHYPAAPATGRSTWRPSACPA